MLIAVRLAGFLCGFAVPIIGSYFLFEEAVVEGYKVQCARMAETNTTLKSAVNILRESTERAEADSRHGSTSSLVDR